MGLQSFGIVSPFLNSKQLYVSPFPSSWDSAYLVEFIYLPYHPPSLQMTEVGGRRHLLSYIAPHFLIQP